MNNFAGVSATPQRLKNPERGSILVMMALLLPILVGVAGLAIDVGYLIDYRRQMQTAADAAAVAGAILAYGNDCSTSTNQTAVRDVARSDAGKNNFSHGGNITVTVNCPPTSGYFIGNNKYAEVIIRQPKAPFLMGALGFGNTIVQARAVAGTSGTVASSVVVFGCSTPLSTCTSGTLARAIEVSGSGDVIVGGPVRVNSSNASQAIVLSGGSAGNPTKLIGSSINVATGGGWSPSAPSTSNVYTPWPVNASAVPDPYASVSAPTVGAGCTGTGVISYSSGTNTIPCGTYTSINLSGGTTTFGPGTVKITGSASGWALNINGSAQVNTATGGVQFYALTGGLRIQTSGVNATLKAATNVTYPFIWYQEKTNQTAAALGSNAVVNLEGIVYMHADFGWSGGGGGGDAVAYTVFVVNKFVYSGGSVYINNNFCSVLSDCSGFAEATSLGE
jgi:hypothetical protein